jgi:Ser/Thr protein kinase RdoA (MazF antagonist)
VTDAAVVGRLLDEYHERAIAPSAVKLLAGSVHESRVSYQLTHPDGAAEVIRAFRCDAPVPLRGRGPDAEHDPRTVTDWLIGRAETLACLADAGYHAPRPVRTRTGDLIGVAGQWLTWATTFVAGQALAPTAAELRALGVALGRLHNVPLPADGLAGLTQDGGRAWAARGAAGLAARHPALAIPATLARLDVVASLVPAGWRPLYTAVRDTTEQIRRASGSVPETLVHDDVWAGNAVQDNAESVTLIDWETGGLGLAVLDLGNCLVECHLDSALPDNQPDGWLITPDVSRISAVASGYASVRIPSDAELALLPTAVRFPAAVVGAVHLEAALSMGVAGPAMDARFERLQNRLAVADAIAAFARRHLAAGR